MLKLIVLQEYKNDVTAKSFWLSTILTPIILIAFGTIVGFLASESDAMQSFSSGVSGIDDDSDLSGSQVVAMMAGIFLTLFVMTYGAMIFNKVKVEKCNRIIEVLATCVTGRTMMLAKIISVGMTGLTQLGIWALLLLGGAFGLMFVFNVNIPLEIIFSWRALAALGWSVAYFIGGYVFYGSLFAAVGATTDRNNENQEYVSMLTFVLIASFYVGIYAVDHFGSPLAIFCSLLPFTSSTCGAVGAISGQASLWFSFLSVGILWASGWIMVSLAGKIYTSSLFLMGTKLKPKDIIAFLRTK